MAVPILIVEDEPTIRENLVYSLESEGFQPRACATGAEAIEAVGTDDSIALVILDIGLPDMSGLDVCRQIREARPMPVIFLTARSDEIDRVVGLEIGGDDYVVKPFSPRELTARVRAVLRRTGSGGNHHPAGSARFEIDQTRLQIRFRGRSLILSRTEYRLLELLIQHPGRVYSRAQLMDHAWDEPESSFERTVDSHIKSLRAKLREIDPADDPIVTHRGLGYSLAEEPA